MHSRLAELLSGILLDDCAISNRKAANLARRLKQEADAFLDEQLYGEAQVLLEMATQLYERGTVKDQEEVASCNFHLAESLAGQGLYGEAAHRYLAAVRLWELRHGSEHKQIGVTLQAYSSALRKLNRDCEAEIMDARSKEILSNYDPQNLDESRPR